MKDIPSRHSGETGRGSFTITPGRETGSGRTRPVDTVPLKTRFAQALENPFPWQDSLISGVSRVGGGSPDGGSKPSDSTKKPAGGEAPAAAKAVPEQREAGTPPTDNRGDKGGGGGAKETGKAASGPEDNGGLKVGLMTFGSNEELVKFARDHGLPAQQVRDMALKDGYIPVRGDPSSTIRRGLWTFPTEDSRAAYARNHGTTVGTLIERARKDGVVSIFPQEKP